MRKVKIKHLNLFQVDDVVQGYLFDIKNEETLKEVYEFYWQFLNPIINKETESHPPIVALLNAGRTKKLGYKDELLILFDDDFEEGLSNIKSALLDASFV